MKDYYNILGVLRSSTGEEIKKAYRKAAMQHHPDRGGDQARFKEINEAYEILSNDDKRRLYDSGIDPLNPNQGHHRYQGGPQFDNMEDIFNSFGFTFGFGPNGPTFRQNRPPVKNKTLNVNIHLSLEEAYTGVDKSLSIRYPSGQEKIVNITIPPGIDNGMAIRYTGMGDDEIKSVPAGDLIIMAHVNPHPVFSRDGMNLLTDVSVDCFDAILGTSVYVTTLDKRKLEISVPAGTQPNTTLSLKNEGMKDQNGNIGKLYVRINVSIPNIKDPFKLDQIKNLK